MSYRDDHDAALARVAALDEELARERADDARRDEHVAKLERQLSSARGDLARAEAELARLRPAEPAAPAPASATAPTPDPDPTAARSPGLAIGLVVVVLVLVLFVALATRGGTSHDEAAAPEAKKQPRPAPATPQRAEPDQVSGYLAEARRRVVERLPVAPRLVAIEAIGIDREGRLHEAYGHVTFEFEADNPTPAEPDYSKLPIGAPRPEPPRHIPVDCTKLERSATDWEPIFDFNYCEFAYPTASRRDGLEPRCTTKAIWAMAIRDGAPPEAIAKLELDGSWTFAIDDPRASFTRTYPDDCVAPTTAERPGG